MAKYRAIADHKTLPYEWGYIWGVAVSDGSIGYHTDRRYPWLGLNATDQEFVELLTTYTEKVTGRKHCITKSAPKGGGHWIGNHYCQAKLPTYRVYITCPPLVEGLTRLIAVDKYSWEVPAEAFWDSTLAQGFLNGYFDGDGMVGSNRGVPYLRWKSINPFGLAQVQDLLQSIEIHSTLDTGDGRLPSLTIWARAEALKYRHNIGITLTRKRNRFDELREGM